MRSCPRCLRNQRNTLWSVLWRVLEIPTVEGGCVMLWKTLWTKKRNQLERLTDSVGGLVVMVFRRIVTTERIRILITNNCTHIVARITHGRGCQGPMRRKPKTRRVYGLQVFIVQSVSLVKSFFWYNGKESTMKRRSKRYLSITHREKWEYNTRLPAYTKADWWPSNPGYRLLQKQESNLLFIALWKNGRERGTVSSEGRQLQKLPRTRSRNTTSSTTRYSIGQVFKQSWIG